MVTATARLIHFFNGARVVCDLCQNGNVVVYTDENRNRLIGAVIRSRGQWFTCLNGEDPDSDWFVLLKNSSLTQTTAQDRGAAIALLVAEYQQQIQQLQEAA